MKTSVIREKFLNYFKKQGHTIVESSSLIPLNDPTLLFTNAGMVQFKDLFLGQARANYQTATSSQRCLRAGGKHNDLENVGYTARHHTFFEMLGNFSFGQYFKKEAIAYAWEFLTKILKLPPERLWVTVYVEDDEAADIWLKEIGVSEKRFSRCGDKDNFWSMGETGPCGPCTEIFYDHGADIPGGPPGSPDEDGDRYIEIWNLVFMQFDRDIHGVLTPLPRPCVDTGMGLERIAAVMQGVVNNYDIDLFQGLLNALSDIVSIDDTRNTSMRVICDHIRSCSFMILDGVVPDNEGRGYVLRRIIRRAIRHGFKLGMNEPFFYCLVPALIKEMGDAYPELLISEEMIVATLLREERQFAKTVTKGMRVFEQAIKSLSDKKIPGALIFQLYDTYGFPPDLTADIARECALTMDYEGFEACMAKQKALSQQSSQFTADVTQTLCISESTDFVGYEQLQGKGRVLALLSNGRPAKRIDSKQPATIVLDKTPFYPTGGGQVADTGVLSSDTVHFVVKDVQKSGEAILHIGHLEQGSISVGEQLNASVDENRYSTALNHSATHLLHQALKTVLGMHVKQKGSLVDPHRLRFDFSHHMPVSPIELQNIERLVNAEIRRNTETMVAHKDLAVAKAEGAEALFGEKYAERVRVVSFGEFSKELCGGTHVKRTGDIGLFKIISESAQAAGVRRIEAVAGESAVIHVEQQEKVLSQLSQRLNTAPNNLSEKLNALLTSLKEKDRLLQAAKAKGAREVGGELAQSMVRVGEINVLSAILPDTDVAGLRQCLDHIKSQYTDFAVLLASTEGGKAKLLSGVSETCLPHFSAVDLLRCVSSKIDGSGGGRPTMAQGGGVLLDKLPAAVDGVLAWVKGKLLEKD